MPPADDHRSVPDAKGTLKRIEIKSETPDASLAITDSEILRKFFIWSGPGAGQPIGSEASRRSGSFIDWYQGIVADRPKGLTAYEVSFYCAFGDRESAGRLAYVVRYELDASTQRGYIYLPGPNDKYYGTNVSTVVHDVEGNWFRSSSSWEALVRPLIEQTGKTSPGGSAAMP